MSKMDEFTFLRTQGLPVTDTTAARLAWLANDTTARETLQKPFYNKTDLMFGHIAQTCERREAITTSQLVTETCYVSPIWLEAGTMVTNISWASVGAASGPTHGLVGLYSKARALLGSSADSTTTARGANTIFTQALTTAFDTTYTGWYYTALAVASSSTVLTVSSRVTPAVALIATTTAGQPLGGLTEASITTALPATFTAVAAAGFHVWMSVS